MARDIADPDVEYIKTLVKAGDIAGAREVLNRFQGQPRAQKLMAQLDTRYPPVPDQSPQQARKQVGCVRRIANTVAAALVGLAICAAVWALGDGMVSGGRITLTQEAAQDRKDAQAVFEFLCVATVLDLNTGLTADQINTNCGIEGQYLTKTYPDRMQVCYALNKDDTSKFLECLDEQGVKHSSQFIDMINS